MARWTVYLRQGPKGWEWTSRSPTNPQSTWWGHYETRGHAVSAAKRSLTRVVGGKTNPDNFDFRTFETKESPDH